MVYVFVLLFGLLVVAGFGLAIRAAIKQLTAGKVHWHEAAKQLEIAVKQRPMQLPEIHGTIDGATVSVMPGAQNNNNFIDFEATYPSLGIGLKISKDSTAKKIFGCLVGSDEIDIDDSYGKLNVDVVIALPSGTELLERDDVVAVSRTLDFVDVTMRGIYLKDASPL